MFNNNMYYYNFASYNKILFKNTCFGMYGQDKKTL